MDRLLTGKHDSIEKSPPIFIFLSWIGAGLVLFLAFVPVRESLSHFIIEDMFYYLEGARQLLHGNPPSLDGENPTNGFHPLWMLICVGVEACSSGDASRAIHTALLLCALSFLATGYVLFRCLQLTQARPLAWPLTALFLFNYRAMTIPLGGLESGIAGLAVSLVVLWMIRHRSAFHLSRSLCLGFLLGICVLARMDALLLAGIVLMWLAIRDFRPVSYLINKLSTEHDSSTQVQTRPLIQSFGLACVAGLLMVVLLVPWFLFSWKVSHTLLPNSRAAIKAWTGHVWNPESSAAGNILAGIKERIAGSIEPLNDIGNLLGFWPLATPLDGYLRYAGAGVTGLCLLLAVLYVIRHFRSLDWYTLGWIPVYLAAHTLYYLFFGRIGIRYLYPLLVPFIVLMGQVAGGQLQQSMDRYRTRKKLEALICVLMVSLALAGADSYRRGYASDRWHPLHPGLYEDLAPWVRQNTPPEARVGSFNAGIMSYFSQRRVLNLDGVMNDSAIRAIQHKELGKYLDEKGVDYLADMDAEIMKFMDGYSGNPDWRKRWVVVDEVARSYGGGAGKKRLVILGRAIPHP